MFTVVNLIKLLFPTMPFAVYTRHSIPICRCKFIAIMISEAAQPPKAVVSEKKAMAGQ